LQFAPWFFILGAAFIFWLNWKSWGRHAVMGFGFFFVTVLPVLGFVPMSYMRVGWVSDHFLYIPMIGIIAYGTSSLAWLYERVEYGAKVAFLSACPLVLGFLLYESHAYAGIWKNEDKMWLYTLERHWNCWQAHNRYGAREFNRGNIKVALKHFLEATRLRPDLAETQNNLGTALLAHKDTQGAVACFSKALKMSPDIIAIQTNLARALLLDGQLQAAVNLYGDLAKRFPDNAVFQCNWGVSLYRAQRMEESIKCFRRALEIDPKLEDARTNLNQVLQEKEANQVLQENNSSAGQSDSE
jgi:tetratricopeptide (TPR) repeat protein